VQLYIQESVTVGKVSELSALSQPHIPQITWAPVSATGMAKVLFFYLKQVLEKAIFTCLFFMR
jgi:hypothetical protein